MNDDGEEELDAGLLDISLSDTDTDTTEKPTQEARTGQSEVEFEDVKRMYRVKVENGEISKTVSLPLGAPVSKPELQTLLHAVEELYFFRRFAEGARFARSVINGDGDEGKLDEDTLKTLRYYERKCSERVA
ncbi:hypothetical protein GGS21DRAFT_325545 [Xylaria nigripes]|nr:hypothetical protein GGS21DRAFT_325545 [Xylaria nigripes]